MGEGGEIMGGAPPLKKFDELYGAVRSNAFEYFNIKSVLSVDEWAFCCSTPTAPLSLLDYVPRQRPRHDDEWPR